MRGGPRAIRRGFLTPFTALAAAVALVPGAASPAAAQERPGGGGGDEPGERPVAETPFLFKAGPSAGSFGWDGLGSQAIEDAALFGLDVESTAGRFVSFRLGAGYGSTRFTDAGNGSEGTAAGDRIDVNQYLVDVVAEGRLAAGPWVRAGVVPFGSVGLGAVVHDPAPDSLITRSQSAFVFGGGVEVRLGPRFGVRAEWRRVQAELQDVFRPQERDGVTRKANRFFATAYVTF